MARHLGYGARVVLGFKPKVHGSDATVTGDDVTAWVEVPFQGVGWIPFLPTPTQTDVPQDQVPKPKTEPQPQVRQPPRTKNDENDLVTNVQIDNTTKKNSAPFALPAWVIGIGLGLGIPLLVLLVPLIIVTSLKRRRARRRRTAPRNRDAAAGAWDELLDRVGELGIAPPTATTRRGAADALAPRLTPAAGGPTVSVLARRTDDAVFSGRELDDAEVDAMWADMIAIVGATRSALPRWRRLIARYRLAAITGWARRVTALANSARRS
jgi:hypothetical protein